jgi:tetratricopeptide (TPR) repeat protein
MLKAIIFIILVTLGGVTYLFLNPEVNKNLYQPQVLLASAKPSMPPALLTPTPTPISLPLSKTLVNDYHIFQSFNNCGPAALSMALSYYGINKSQEELGQQLRPYQVPGGNNDDKSVTLEEVAGKSKEFGLIPYLRPNGNAEIIKKFIASDIPVITRTWLKENDDIGHYRIIKGYDDATQEFIQDDSLQGKNLRYSYANFAKIWDKFNYEYLALVPEEKKGIAEEILGQNLDEKFAWRKAIELSQQKLSTNSGDVTAGFNLSVAYYKLGEYEKSVEAFEKVEDKLSFRTLWYQIEPILSYYELGNYDRVFEITDRVLNNHNRAFSELYFLRGQIYLKQGGKEKARSEFEKAVLYNRNFQTKIPEI